VSPDAASRQDKVALVTGASRGIGRAIANRLVADGVAVVMNGRDKQVLDEAVEQVGRLGGRAIAVAGSISDADLPERLVATAFDAFGGLATSSTTLRPAVIMDRYSGWNVTPSPRQCWPTPGRRWRSSKQR
jgi:NAD(P)-dependent dehydrogenase (short-subunit alcohol dehydrogenase family)